MTMFKYQGPVDSSVTLKIDGKDHDVVFFREQSVDLPADHEYVKTLVALNHLVPVDGADAAGNTAGETAEPSIKKGAK